MRRLLPLLPLLLASGCQLVDLELSVTNMCRSWEDRRLPGAPVDGRLVHTFTLEDLPEASELQALDVSVERLAIDVRAAAGLADLRFVDHIVIRAGDTLLLDCDGSCVAPDGTLHLEPIVPDEILDLAARGELEITLEISGETPPDEWAVDLDACVTASASYDP